jgi:transcriptional regulator with XRE-family HTH domain
MPTRKKYTGSSKTLGEIIARRRQEKNISQEGLAKAVGMSRNTLFRIETGLSGTHMTKLEALCAMLDLDINKVLSETTSEREKASYNLSQSDPKTRTQVISLITDLLIKIDALNKDQLVAIKDQLNLLNHYIDLISQLDLLNDEQLERRATCGSTFPQPAPSPTRRARSGRG